MSAVAYGGKNLLRILILLASDRIMIDTESIAKEFRNTIRNKPDSGEVVHLAERQLTV